METPTTATEGNHYSGIKLYIDSILSNKRFSLFSTVVSLLMVVVYILAVNAPDSFIIRDRPEADPITSVYGVVGYPEKSFDIVENPVIGIEVSELGTSNKFIVLDMTPFKLKSGEKMEMSVEIETSAFTISKGKADQTIILKERSLVNFTCSFSQDAPCNNEEILRVPIKDDKEHFYFTVKILNNNELASNVESFRIRSITFNLSSRIYLFAVKFLLILATIGCYVWFKSKLNSLDQAFMTLEQKTFKFLLGFLFFVNEPISTYVFDNKVYAWIMSVLFAAFSAFLVRYWLTKIFEFGGSDSSLIDKSSTFVKLFTVIYFVIVSMAYVEYGNLKLRDPLTDFNTMEDKFFIISRVLLLISLLVALLRCSFKLQRIVDRSHDIPERDSSFFLFSLFFLVTHLLMVLTGMLSPMNYDTFKIILFSGISSLYILSSGYLFLPTKEGIEQAIHLKKYDNPAAREKYQDLEDTVHHEEAQKGTEHALVTGSTDPHHHAKTDREAEKAYPYETKDDHNIEM